MRPAAPTAATGPARPASAGRRVLAQAAFETRTLLGNGEQLLVAVVLPALALIALHLTDVPDLGPGSRTDLATAGVLGLAVVSTAFTGQAIQTGFDRRYGVLRLLGTTPLGRDGLLLAKMLAVAVVLAVQVVLLSVLALALGWWPELAALPGAVLTLALGGAAFVALALVLAGTMRAEAVLAVANLLWVLLLGAGGLVLSADQMPDAVGGLVRWLPSAALGDALRAGLVDGVVPWREWGLLALWALGLGALAARTFRWDD